MLTKRDIQNEKKVKLNSLSYPKVRTFQGKSSIGVGMRILRIFKILEIFHQRSLNILNIRMKIQRILKAFNIQTYFEYS